MNAGDEDYVLTGKNKWTEPRTFRRFYQNFMKKIGIEPLKFHSLRHTFASMNIENGADVKTISEILGHSDVDVTLKIYTHTSNKAKRKAVEKFEALLKEKGIKGLIIDLRNNPGGIVQEATGIKLFYLKKSKEH